MQRSTANGCFAMDVFDAAFEQQSDTYARANVRPRALDSALLGWHFDKETHWTSMDLRYWFDPAFFPAGSAGLANATDFLFVMGYDLHLWDDYTCMKTSEGNVCSPAEASIRELKAENERIKQVLM